MLFDKHGNGNGLDDLYVLPETMEERVKVTDYLISIKRSFTIQRSDVKGQAWYGKAFIDVPFGESLKAEIIKAVSGA